MNTTRCLLVALACITPVAGFSPRSPYRHVVSGQECFVVMDPYLKPEQATAYRVTNDGFKQLWQAKGWYGYQDEIFLASDGMSLVRIRKFVDSSDSKMGEQTVLFIYFNGKLVKEYKLSELASDMGLIRDGGYQGSSQWAAEAAIVLTDRHDIDTDRKDDGPGPETYHSYNHFAFGVITLEKKEFFLDLLDGKRIDKTKMEPIIDKKRTTPDPSENQKSEQYATPNGP